MRLQTNGLKGKSVDLYNILFNTTPEGTRLTNTGEKRFVTLEDGRVVYIEGPPQGTGSAHGSPPIIAGGPAEARWTNDMDHAEAAALIDRVYEEWWPKTEEESTARASLATLAIRRSQEFSDIELLSVFSADGSPIGFAGLLVGKPDGNYKLGYLGTKHGGVGRSMMEMILQRAADDGVGIGWGASGEAVGFYLAIGMQPYQVGNLFNLRPYEVLAWLEKHGGSKSLDLLEPRNGIFVADPEFFGGAGEGEKRFVTLEDGRVIHVEGPGQGLGAAQRNDWLVTQRRFSPTGSGEIEFGEVTVAAPASETGAGIFVRDRELQPYWLPELNRTEADNLLDALEVSWEPGLRRGTAAAAVEDAYKYSHRLLLFLDQNELGEMRDIYAVASVRDLINPDYNELKFMATKQSGLGRVMMQMIMEDAHNQGRGLSWVSIPEAVKFYEALGFGGMTQAGRPFRYVVNKNRTAEWVEGQKTNLALLEPRSGVFAVATEDWFKEEPWTSTM